MAPTVRSATEGSSVRMAAAASSGMAVPSLFMANRSYLRIHA
jgi:hypothetical protein